MSFAQVNAEKLRICWGIKRGRRLVCGEPVADGAIIEEVKRLIEELRRRVEKHKDRLESAAFIDELINLLERWLEEHENDRGRKIKEAKRIARKMVKLLKKLRRRWVETYWRQLLELMEMLERNAIDIIVTGSNNGEKSLMVHLYNKDVTIEVNKVAKSESVTIRLTLKGLGGDNVKVANTFSDEKLLKAVQYGWEMTDGTIKDNHPTMGTTQPWQAILWTLCYPNKIHIYISGINMDEDGASIMWDLTAKDHRARSKKEVAKEVERLGTERLKAFMAPAVWGDGDVDVKKSIRLIMGLAKYDLWLGIIERLVNELGFTMYPVEYRVEVAVWTNRAVRLARDWLAIPDLKELIELGASLPGGEKFKRIIELASKDIKERGKNSSINIPGTDISMSIHIDSHYKVELRAWRRYENETLSLVEELEKAGYEPSIYADRGGHVVSIMHAKIRDSPLKPIVCKKLSDLLNKARNEKRRKKISKAMRNLKCFDNA
ncbi:hypothetical protein VMUT_1888 [Vulcanisaeta moutnovskia 768-28]|uniref:Uncharacterized protein n=1 Tax=Vulcanisaeta moutnovskia (strain 768-28) TaxID=985053 RepID=F0QVR5_VULM7|nr:hypothetical protein [Vulcanisaeta moutnovskia]ADY02089.1 hypothetical protein VMUT_1888 [Vulcanisaeta moutnovskia 768-28]